MAKRRMFSIDIISSDAFTDMPLSAQALYFHLGMAADDDGFVNCPNKIQRSIGASADDMNILRAKHFVLVFDSGVLVIKHWKINNTIQKDRYHETKYTDELSMLLVKKNGAYTFIEHDSDLGLLSVDTTCIQDVSILETESSLGKSSLGKSKDTLSAFAADVIGYLNNKTGKSFRPSSKSTMRHISARVNEGYSLDDFKAVIDTKVDQWKRDKKMCGYLRPETLFGTKFESYLNEGGEKHDYSGFRVR